MFFTLNLLKQNIVQIMFTQLEGSNNLSADVQSAGENQIGDEKPNYISEDELLKLYKEHNPDKVDAEIKRQKLDYVNLKEQKQETSGFIIAETQAAEQELKQSLVNMDVIHTAGVLRKGSANSSAVTEVQKFLNTYHDSKLAIDGDFGGGTYKAVIAFQKTHGLSPDGVIGPKTKGAMDKVIYDNHVSSNIELHDPTQVFKTAVETSLTSDAVNEQVDTTHNKLDALNQLMIRGSEVSEAIESYINGGNRDQFISNKGGVYGWVRELIGENNFDQYLDRLDEMQATQRDNINDGLDQLLASTDSGDGDSDTITGFSGQLEKDALLIAGGLLLSDFTSLPIPLFHISNGLSRSLVNHGVDLTQANNFGAYIEQTSGNEPFDIEKQYVSDHGLDALSSTVQLKHTLREYGISDHEIQEALNGKVSDTSEKISTVIKSFFTHILTRDLDALTQGSFGFLEKSFYIPMGKKIDIPGNPDINLSSRYLGGDPKYGAARKIAKKIQAEITSLENGADLSQVLKNIDTRMAGIAFLLGAQVNDYAWFSGGDTQSTQDLNEKLDYMVALDQNSPFFETYSALAEDREFLREYSILTKFESIEDILHNFPASPEAHTQLSTLDKDSSIDDFKAILSDPDVDAYLKALTTGTFTEYRRSQLTTQSGLNQIELDGVAKHGLPITRETSPAEVIDQMKKNTVDGEKSVLTTIEETLIDNGITTLSSADIEAAILDNWTVLELSELEGIISNTGRGEGQQNDKITTFKKLIEERGDEFLFQTKVSKTMKYLDANGDTHEVTHDYTILFRPECKNPIIHRDIIDASGKIIPANQVAGFNTAVPSLITGTIPVWINVPTGKSSSSSSGNGATNSASDDFTTTPGDADAVNINNATTTTNNTVSGGASGATSGSGNPLGI